jgi:hypothetical protein
MSPVPDFTESEQWAVVETTLRERWPDATPEIQLADVEIKMFPADRELTVCPAMFREHGKTGFVIIKVAEKGYRSQLYYHGFQQYGTGRSDYDDITDCAVTMLQVHADQEAKDREESAQQHTRIQKYITSNPEEIQ